MKVPQLLTLLVVFLIGFNISAQDKSPVLMTIGDTPITLSEFENIYKKNNSNMEGQEQQPLEEYLELFINFKLKVNEALTLKMDTDKSFINELEGYRKQLAQPYLVDKEVNELLVQEAYNRMKFDIHAKHILVTVANDATPSDTLLAFAKISAIRKQAIAKNANFDKIMQTSNDPKTKTVIAEDLGYFTAFQMVYNFETAAFNTEVGEVSPIIKTRFGYHVLKIFDKRPARGQIRAAHIMVATPQNMSEDDAVQKKAKIDELFQKLKDGEDFGKLAKLYSDDKGSAARNGELPWFGSGRMVEEFENAAFAIDTDGDITTPVKTKYGWHIIKRIEKKEVGSFEEMKAEIKNKIGKDGRSTKSKESLIAKIKADYNYNPDLKKRDEFLNVMDDSYQQGKWTAEKAGNLNGVMFTLHDEKYSGNKVEVSQQQFASYLVRAQRKFSTSEKKEFIESAFESFVNETCVDFEDKLLEAKYIEFNLLMKEYRDGILLFELMDKRVWSKAVKDSTGLLSFHEKNKNDYMWEQRADVAIYTCSSQEIADNAKKLIKKQAKKGYTDAFIKEQLNTDSQLNCEIESGTFQRGDNQVIDEIEWTNGIVDLKEQDGKIRFVNVKQIMAPMPKTLNESRGLVTADYQKYLEQEWIKELRAKYPAVVNKEVLSMVKP